jgi:hypothetical protein
VSADIGATAPHLDFSMQLYFESEESRRRWAAGEDHQQVWQRALDLSEDAQWVGYDVVAQHGD